LSSDSIDLTSLSEHYLDDIETEYLAQFIGQFNAPTAIENGAALSINALVLGDHFFCQKLLP
jgi:hypothetical protein